MIRDSSCLYAVVRPFGGHLVVKRGASSSWSHNAGASPTMRLERSFQRFMEGRVLAFHLTDWKRERKRD
jgi:hypothetical protein